MYIYKLGELYIYKLGHLNNTTYTWVQHGYNIDVCGVSIFVVVGVEFTHPDLSSNYVRLCLCTCTQCLQCPICIYMYYNDHTVIPPFYYNTYIHEVMYTIESGGD